MALELELIRDRQQNIARAAEQHRGSRDATMHGRLVRQARRAERRTRSYAEQAQQLRARIAEIEAGR